MQVQQIDQRAVPVSRLCIKTKGYQCFQKTFSSQEHQYNMQHLCVEGNMLALQPSFPIVVTEPNSRP